MRCPKCNRRIDKNIKFCPMCGTQIPRSRKKQRKQPGWIALVAILLVVILVAGWFLGTLLARLFASGSKQETTEIHSAEEAISHAKQLGEEMGYENAFSELSEKVTTEIDGDHYYRLQQNYKGIPVYGKTIVYAVSAGGEITSIDGNIEDIAEGLNLIPSVTQAQVEQSVEEYIQTQLEITDTFEIALPTKDLLCIYQSPEDGTSHLAYRIHVGFLELVVDAQNCEVLTWGEMVQDITGYLASDRLRTFPVVERGGNYYLEDEVRKLSVYNLEGKSHTDENCKNSIQYYSQDIVFGNNGDQETLEDAARLYITISKMYDGFSTLCGFTDVLDWTFIFYNDGSDFGAGAYGGADNIANLGIIQVGDKYAVDDIDVFAHEYGHVISKRLADLSDDPKETQAIGEAFSDIMGELYEAWHYQKEPDWVMKSDKWTINNINRSIRDPRSTGLAGHMDDTKDPSFFVNKNHYYCSTVISHTAYLMWNGIDNNASKKIDVETLVKLWYRAMLMMPSDCNFVECRTLVELAASTMKLTDPQIQCVSEAFDAVGIPRTSDNPNDRLVHYAATGNTSVKGTIYEVKMMDGIERVYPVTNATLTVYSSESKKAYKEISMADKEGFFEIDLPAGTYSIVVSAEGYIGQTITFELADQETRYLQISLDSAESTKNEDDTEISTPPYDVNNLVSDAYSDYIAKNIYNVESYFHIPKVNANLPEIDKTNAKIYDDYYGYMQTHVYGPIAEGSNTAIEEISYIWGVKDQYLSILMLVMWGGEPVCDVYTVSLETGALVENNELLSAYGISLEDFNELVDQASRNLDDNLRWPAPYVNPGNADLCAVGNSEEWGYSILVNLTGSTDPVYPWDSSKTKEEAATYTPYQSTDESTSGSIAIQPGYYVQDGNELNTLTVHAVSNDSITFSVWWYRIWDIFEATATGSGNAVSFDYTKHSVSASGSITFAENSAVLTLTNCDDPYVHTGDYHFKLIGRVLTEEQLAEISTALGVPSNLDVEFKQGEPAYWEGGGFYRTNVEILYNGELIAGASVDSLTGSLAGNIYTYSG